jgi:hypothetical protein
MHEDLNVGANIIQILADLPVFLRKPILKGKIKEFFSMSDLDQHQGVSLMLKVAAEMETKILSVLIKTWMEVLYEFDAQKITNIFVIYCHEILKNRIVFGKLNLDSIIEVFLSLEKRQRDKLIDCLKEAIIISYPNRNYILKIMPERAIKILEMNSD